MEQISVFPLSALQEGANARVRAMRLTGSMRLRLQDLGLVQGTRVTCVQRAAAGDPIAFLFRGTVIALRRADAARIEMGGMP